MILVLKTIQKNSKVLHAQYIGRTIFYFFLVMLTLRMIKAFKVHWLDVVHKGRKFYLRSHFVLIYLNTKKIEQLAAN